MQKIVLSNDQLTQVVNLRKGGSNWLQIQKITGIPRRIAKQEYENWERNQSSKKLEEARKDVAAEAFREHVNFIIVIAESLVAHMRAPSLNDINTEADQFLNELWETNIVRQLGQNDASGITQIANPQRNLRENKMLFESLKDHTREKVRWEILNEWKSCWNNSIKLLAELRKKIREQIKNFLNQEEEKEKGFLSRFAKDTNKKDPITQMTNAVQGEILRRVRDNDPNLERPVVRVMPQPDGIYQLIFYDSYSIIFKFTDRALAEKAESTCNKVARNLYVQEKLNRLSLLGANIRAMDRMAERLEESLNPLMLRPMILRTRCELCPA